MRYFDFYYTAELASGIRGMMRVEEDQALSRAAFLMHLKSMPAPFPTTGQGWLDNPASALTDRMFRDCHFASYVIVIGVMLCVALGAQ